MNKKVYLGLILTFIFSVFVSFPSRVDAEETKKTLESVNAYNVGGDVVGNISLYEDYTIGFSFKYRIKDILVTVCEKNSCEETKQVFNYGNNTVLNEAPYDVLATIDYDLKEHLKANENDVTYIIKASADFKPTLTSTIGVILTVSEEILIEGQRDIPEDSLEEKIMRALEKARDICNRWIIPIIYIALGVTLLTKSIFLCIDLIKNSDVPEVRSEKLKAFAYIGLVIVLIATLNTGLGFITGLFG